MRFLILFLAFSCWLVPPAFSASDAGFNEFMKSREIVTTLYFKSSAEGLSNGERERLAESVSKLKELQENGRMIRVEGFSSPEGDQEKNFRLSFFRARFVAELLEDKGLPAEVTLTGYGDLRASSDDFSKERRVEIASYLKPVTMKRIKIADEKNKPSLLPQSTRTQVAPKDRTIDSYRVDQAIRRKIEDKNKSLADQYEELDSEATPDVSQSEFNADEVDLERGYSQWRKSIDPDYSPKFSQSKKTVDSDLKRSYSQWQKSIDPETSPGVTQVMPVKAPRIDALMIEQAIMEKIGIEPTVPSGAVTQVSLDYQVEGSSN